jgi:hypothetical protein
MSDEPNIEKPPKKKRSGSEKRARGIVNTFRSTKDERAQAEIDASGLGLTFGSYVRWLLFERPQTRPVRRPLPGEALLAQIKGEAGRVDGNLAQLLKLANRGDIVYTDELADAAKAVRDFYVKASTTLFGGS